MEKNLLRKKKTFKTLKLKESKRSLNFMEIIIKPFTRVR